MAYFRTKIKVEGSSDLEDALNDLSKATAGNVLKRAVGAAGAFIAEKAAERAPRAAPGTSKSPGKLRREIKVSKPKIISAGKQAFARAMKETGDRAIAAQAARSANREAGGTGRSAVTQVGPTKLAGEGVLQEFGTVHHKAQPFMRPTWDQHGPEAAQIMKEALAEEIGKAQKRAARKAARIAGRSS